MVPDRSNFHANFQSQELEANLIHFKISRPRARTATRVRRAAMTTLSHKLNVHHDATLDHVLRGQCGLQHHLMSPSLCHWALVTTFATGAFELPQSWQPHAMMRNDALMPGSCRVNVQSVTL